MEVYGSVSLQRASSCKSPYLADSRWTVAAGIVTSFLTSRITNQDITGPTFIQYAIYRLILGDLSGHIISVRPLQPEKALSPMEVTEFRYRHTRQAAATTEGTIPMEVTGVGIRHLPVKPHNQSHVCRWGDRAGIVTPVRPLQPLKA